jgi:alpha-ketoglutarate-dependent 2,4-dichlorophenoxyacetate dioxygenase
MGITVQPVTPEFVAEVGDVDLAKPLSAEDEAQIKQAFWKYAVLIFPGQELDEDRHLAFAARFGPLEVSTKIYRTDLKDRLQRVEMADISNLDHEGRLWEADSRNRAYKLGNRLWHTDASFKYVPARASLLYARSVAPIGGHTEFADMRAAYDALPDDMKARLEGLVAEHAIAYSRAKIGFTQFLDTEKEGLPPVPQALVRTHADSGRRTLYIASHIGRIVGMGEAEGRALVDELMAHATQRQFVYTHRWRVGDLVIYDDRCTMHRAGAFDDLRWPRDLLRATVSDELNTCEREGLTVTA